MLFRVLRYGKQKTENSSPSNICSRWNTWLFGSYHWWFYIPWDTYIRLILMVNLSGAIFLPLKKNRRLVLNHRKQLQFQSNALNSFPLPCNHEKEKKSKEKEILCWRSSTWFKSCKLKDDLHLNKQTSSKHVRYWYIKVLSQLSIICFHAVSIRSN